MKILKNTPWMVLICFILLVEQACIRAHHKSKCSMHSGSDKGECSMHSDSDKGECSMHSDSDKGECSVNSDFDVAYAAGLEYVRDGGEYISSLKFAKDAREAINQMKGKKAFYFNKKDDNKLEITICSIQNGRLFKEKHDYDELIKVSIGVHDISTNKKDKAIFYETQCLNNSGMGTFSQQDFYIKNALTVLLRGCNFLIGYYTDKKLGSRHRLDEQYYYIRQNTGKSIVYLESNSSNRHGFNKAIQLLAALDLGIPNNGTVYPRTKIYWYSEKASDTNEQKKRDYCRY